MIKKPLVYGKGVIPKYQNAINHKWPMIMFNFMEKIGTSSCQSATAHSKKGENESSPQTLD